MKLPQKVVRPVTLFSMGAFVVLAAAPAVLSGEGFGLCGSCNSGSVAMAATSDDCGGKDKGSCGAVAVSAGLASLVAQGECSAAKATQAAGSGCCASKATAATASLASLETAASCGDKKGCGDKDDCDSGATAATASLASLEADAEKAATCCSAVKDAVDAGSVAEASDDAEHDKVAAVN